MNIGDMARTWLYDDDDVRIDYAVMVLDIYPEEDPSRALVWVVWHNKLDVYQRAYPGLPIIDEFLDSLTPGGMIATDLEDLT